MKLYTIMLAKQKGGVTELANVLRWKRRAVTGMLGRDESPPPIKKEQR